ncbi:uncharacterized protein LOC133707206 [Rosa rugosa]|uniref:uncharacterized protein LOC133707206 n=1 Tax=Rosa rugosa TaxID=74645 RepID=UPI002B401C0D|nr:uncharacterized protein LOC133707206 [Rosa rugosa]
MASSMVIKVRYFGTSKVKVGDRERYLKAPIDENGQLSFDMGGLREKICSTCYLPPGSDITLVYIDEDGDVVTLVDDDDLRDAMRQHLKSFRIDVLMNDNEVYRKSSSKRSTRVMMDSVGSSLGTSDDNMETNRASTSGYATRDNDYTSSPSFHECSFIADDLVNPTVACFKRNYSEAISGMMLHTGACCDGCGCNPITGSRFKSIL